MSTLVRGYSFCPQSGGRGQWGGEWAGCDFYLLILSQDRGWSHSQVHSWQQQRGWLRGTFPPDCLTPRRPKPTPGIPGAASHPLSGLLITAGCWQWLPFWASALPLVFSERNWGSAYEVGVIGDWGFSTLATLTSWGRIILCPGGLSCALNDIWQHPWSLPTRYQ